MSPPPAPCRPRRVAIGVVALYGLLLQLFLAGWTPPPIAAVPGVICAAHDGPAAPDAPLRHHHQCCPAVQVTAIAPPLEEAVAVPVPRPSATLAWRPEAETLRTGPPTHSHSARGPPSA